MTTARDDHEPEPAIDYPYVYQQYEYIVGWYGDRPGILYQKWEDIPVYDSNVSDEQALYIGHVISEIRANLDREREFQYLAESAAKLQLPPPPVVLLELISTKLNQSEIGN